MINKAHPGDALHAISPDPAPSRRAEQPPIPAAAGTNHVAAGFHDRVTA
jgi:hypothetical protein